MTKLSDAKLRTLTQPGKHFDGGGLYLELTAAGGRYWRLKYREVPACGQGKAPGAGRVP